MTCLGRLLMNYRTLFSHPSFSLHAKARRRVISFTGRPVGSELFSASFLERPLASFRCWLFEYMDKLLFLLRTAAPVRLPLHHNSTTSAENPQHTRLLVARPSEERKASAADHAKARGTERLQSDPFCTHRSRPATHDCPTEPPAEMGAADPGREPGSAFWTVGKKSLLLLWLMEGVC